MLNCLFLLAYLNLPPVPPVFCQIDSVKILQKGKKKTAGRIMAGRFLWGALKKRKILYVKPLKSKDCGKSLILRIISVARVLVGQGLQSKHVHAQKVLASFRRAA